MVKNRPIYDYSLNFAQLFCDSDLLYSGPQNLKCRTKFKKKIKTIRMLPKYFVVVIQCTVGHNI